MVATEYKSPQTIIDNLHSAVIVIGENLEIVCINPAAEMLFHISNNRAIRKNIRELVINEHEFFDRLERSMISSHPYTVYEGQLQHTQSSDYRCRLFSFPDTVLCPRVNFYYSSSSAYRHSISFPMKIASSASMKPANACYAD